MLWLAGRAQGHTLGWFMLTGAKVALVMVAMVLGIILLATLVMAGAVPGLGGLLAGAVMALAAIALAQLGPWQPGPPTAGSRALELSPDRCGGLASSLGPRLDFSAQVLAHDLADHRLRQLVAELDGRWNLVARQVRAAVGQELLLPGRCVRRSTTNALRHLAASSSGTPTTAASATPGCVSSTSSTSRG